MPNVLTRKLALFIVALLGLMVAGCANSENESSGPIDPGLSDEAIAQLSEDAFYWGLNIAGFYELRYVFTQQEGQPAYRGINRLKPDVQLYDASMRFATTVNASTLYSGGFFDVSEEPVVIQTPRVPDDRYWSVQLGDHNADWFFTAGSQFGADADQRYLVVGPRWRGELPPGFAGTNIIRATSDSFVLATRVEVTTRTEEDLAAARSVVTGVGAVPLSVWAEHGGRIPPLDQQPVVKADYEAFPRMSEIADIGRSMTAVDYLQLLSLAINDPSITKRTDSVKETQTLQRLESLGLRAGETFDPNGLSDSQIDQLNRGFDRARKNARTAFADSQIDMNGWRLQSSLFFDDLDYVAKAGADDVAWGTPVPYESHTIAFQFDDSQGQTLDGDHRYTLTFDMANLLPVTEFWELPVYDSAGYFIDNPVDRYSVTSAGLAAGQYTVEDGKLTLYLQPAPPADPDQLRNWLPTPAGDTFQLAARFYGPTSGLLDGTYPMPKPVRTNN
ncbi:DUF1214 domain-containing protein [Nocardia cyriacigeorgica]|jgi:hypothetical protein|uniref:DUF1214 domain-containing protein n=1 Tax=Nocardia cyriacigeorgica TaxID=135487 RepID=UPI000CE9D134|nr:DUF1214 domain-containing protein [Nocardia cyriacigeorgica]AVH24072.1 DUF1254 domain-containing protein [Nocardia cyriacigeorgica]MBF6326170.1 DUF1254 domain-containing protein [Nocardia cyriacigeorgica]MBF6499138.1 DUF1254 domain-containing protein [Nocardia cyriacigeorgica]PPJ08938.1 DUF1254 domain-containing protein [Nocardia cyriacigeorgica]